MNRPTWGRWREPVGSSHRGDLAPGFQTRQATGIAASLFEIAGGLPQQHARTHRAIATRRASPFFRLSPAARGSKRTARPPGQRLNARLRSHVPLLAVLALVLVLSAACDAVAESGAALGDETPTPTPMENRDASATTEAGPTATPGVAAERDGAAGFRKFAGQVQTAFDTSDVAFFRHRLRGTDATCTPADLERKGIDGRQVCTTVGATYRGFLIGRWRSEWETLPVEDALASLMAIVETAEPAAQDMIGTGELRVHALNVAPGEYRIIATALALRPANDPHVGPTRVAFALTAVFDGAGWQFTSLITAPVLGEDLLRPDTDFTARLTGWEPYMP